MSCGRSVIGGVPYGDTFSVFIVFPAEEPPPAHLQKQLYVDDVRNGVHTRRDSDRPVEAFRGLTVELWGCGALGSWLAELLVRAGVAHIALRDPGLVAKGLLLRQNYTELDVGRPKVDALADRLRALDSSLVVRPFAERCEPALASSFDCDVIIDATVNTRTASLIDGYQRSRSLSSPVI